MKSKYLFFLFSLFLSTQKIFSQCGGTGEMLTVQNPSFEGPSQPHVVPGPWQACYGTPDTQPGQWGFTQTPSEGTSYISALQSGPSAGGYQEGASQQLSSCMVAGTTYTFTLDLAFSNVYNTAEPLDCYGSLQIWGASSICGKDESLWQSGVITNTAWQTYTITLTPAQNWCYISMAPYFITPCSGYINIMIDNLGPIVSPGPGLNATVNSDISCSNTILGDISCPADSIILAGLFNNSPAYATLLTDTTWTQNVTYQPGSAGTQDIFITAYTQNGDTLNDTITFNLVEITPDFTAANVCAGNPVSFANSSIITSGSIVNEQWNFGDGVGTSSQQSPSYTYSSPGTYSVQLIVTSDLGCTDSITKTIQVFENPLADFSVPNVCLNYSSQFINLSSIGNGTLASSDWNFGDGTGTSSAPNPSYTYLSEGTYNVSMVETSLDGCTSAVTKTTIIHPLPNTSFAANNSCLNDSMYFTNASSISTGNIASYTWNFGDASPLSSLQNPSHLYTNAGSYTVLLTANSDSGCVDSIAKNVVVNPLPAADFTTANVCLDNIANFTDASTVPSGNITSYFWNFGDSNNSNSQNTSNQYSASGNYSVSLLVNSDSGCADTVSKLIEIYDEPSAAFNVNNVCNYDSAQFNDASTIADGSISSYLWDLGDGSNSNSQNISHLFNTAGNYSVIFTVASGNGCVDSATQSIIIFPVPVALFTANNVCQYTAAQFTDASNISSGSILNEQWDFGDASPPQAGQNPSHDFSSEGIYFVELLVTSDSGCVDSILQQIIIHPVPTANFSFNNECLYNAVQFTDSTFLSDGTYSLNWNFGDGVTSALQNPQHLYSADGTYNVELLITSDSNCSDTIVQQVIIYPVPVSDFSFVNDCVNDTADFTDLSNISSGTITNWNWDFGDANISSQQNPSNLYSVAGTYSVTLIVESEFSCLDTVTKTIEQYPIPTADFIADSVCLNDITTFSDLSSGNGDTLATWIWNFGDGTPLSNNQNPTHNYSAANAGFTVTLIVQSNNNCIDDIMISIPVYPLPVANFVTDTVCLNEPPTNFSGAPSSIPSPGLITSFDWKFGDNNSGTGINAAHTYQTAGTFNVELIVTSDKGCDSNIVKQVKVKELPIVNFVGNTEGCDYPFCTQLFESVTSPSNTTITSILWDFGDGSPVSSQSNPPKCFTPAGDYIVQLMATTSENCTDTSQPKTITVFPKPVAGFEYEPSSTTIFNPTINFTDISTGSINWFWNFGDSDTSAFQNPVHEYSDTGTYTVMQIVASDYCLDTIYQTVIIKAEFIIYIPNAFTPDGDGVNDVFLPQGIGFKNENYSLYIFDRWGDLIYETHNANGFWDGKIKNKPAKEDVYVYELKMEDVFNTPHRIVGKVTVLHR